MMEDLKYLMKKNYVKYASYVILDRSIPHIIDGLKPVQRRILHTLFSIDDGKLHKVANVVGQTMAYHPHGDAAINDALVNMAMKGYLLDMQGNFGNLYTGDPAAAARYIETRLSPLARATLFNRDLTAFIPSYDGRNQEPVTLPAKIPLLLMQGAEGIAVGMATKIFPHNFCELLEAEIAVLENRPFALLPDFPTGGIMDASDYQHGQGKVKLRAKIEVKDSKTLVIREVCYGTTTESLIRSIDEAAKRGKIKIDSIDDYTAENVEIEIKLPRGHYAESLIKGLYAFTDCEISLSSQVMVIKDDLPFETTVDEILRYHVNCLKAYLQEELEIELGRLQQKIFEKTLERIFIENRLYKSLEKVKSSEQLLATVEKSLKPYLEELPRPPLEEDFQRLLTLPIRRISRFDLEKNQGEIRDLEQRIEGVQKDLKNMTRTTVRYVKNLLKTFGKAYPRKTQVQAIEDLDIKSLAKKQVKVALDVEGGYVGSKVVAAQALECSNYDKLLILFDDGTYTVINIPEKQYIGQEGRKAVYVGIADKKTIFRAVYRDPKSHLCYGKRFVISKFILGRTYTYFEEGMQLEVLTTAAQKRVTLAYKPKARQKVNKESFELDSIAIKGVTAKGIRLSTKAVKKLTLVGTKEEGQVAQEEQLELLPL